MKSLKFHTAHHLPEEYRRETDYVVAWNDHEISVGDQLDFKDIAGGPVKVDCLWLVIGSKILESDVMETGHDHIVRFDRSIGPVDAETAYFFDLMV